MLLSDLRLASRERFREERANFLVIMWFLFGGVSSSSLCLG